MNEDLRQKFMSIGNDSYEDAEAIFQITSDYLNELKTEKYKPEFATFIEGFVNKMIVIAENFESDEDFIITFETDLLNFVNTINNPNSAPHSVVGYYNKIYSDIIKFYNLINKTKPGESIGMGPFQPENCDKSRIVFIISEVIEMIRNSPFLKEKAKQNIITKLSNVIDELNNPKTNWNIYFKQMGNTIMFISALASIAGGIDATKNLLSAKDKLDEANKAVEQTSLTFSNKDVKEVFVVNEVQLLNANVVFQIEDKSPIIEENKESKDIPKK